MNINDRYKLSNDIEIPKLGYSTFKTPDDKSGVEAIVNAIELGYRHIDTAQGYRNEESVGKAIKKVKVPREELFITTKVTNSICDYDTTIDSLNDSLAKLDLDYIDLVLIHWPNPKAFRNNWQKRNKEVWLALEEFYNQGKTIGESNPYRSRCSSILIILDIIKSHLFI